MDPKKKFYLFKQSKHFCSVPWNHFKIAADGNVTTCVKGSVTLGNIHDQTISEILSNSILTDIKQKLYADEPHENCSKCQRLEVLTEDKQYRYLRDLYNNYFLKNDIDYSDSNLFKLSGVDLHWGSTCNLKCVTCWEKQSSAIATELGIPIVSTSKRAIESLTEWIVDNQSNLKEIYLSGGEPTLIKHNLRLLEKIEKKESLLLRVNSNLIWETKNPIVQEIMKFPNVLWTVSADDMDQRFDYIRYGADWTQFIRNLGWLRSTHVKIRLNSVFFVNNATRITDTQEFFRLQYGIDDFTINQCGMDQFSLRPRNLPTHLKNLARDKIYAYQSRYHMDNNLSGQLDNCIKELETEPDNGPSYQSYFDSIDSRRGTNWRNVFPELVHD